MKRIVCKSEDGVEVGFDYDFEPFFLLDCEGITAVFNNVVTSENSNMDGSTKQGITTRERFIVITAEMHENYADNREWLYRAFKPRTTGKFIYTENEESRTIEYEVESIEIEHTGVVRGIVISLKCADPFFQAMDKTVVDMASWTEEFEFEHEFLEEGEEFGIREAEIIKEIQNESAAKSIGITIEIVAEDVVIDPYMHHIESGDFILLHFAMRTGDKIVISTTANDKNAYLERQGQRTIINQYLDEDAEFIQLAQGLNTLKYDASTGIDYMNVRITYHYRFLGV